MGICGAGAPSGSRLRTWLGTDGKALCRGHNDADQAARDAVKGAREAQAWTFASCNDGHAYTSPVAHFPADALGLSRIPGGALGRSGPEAGLRALQSASRTASLTFRTGTAIPTFPAGPMGLRLPV